MAERRTPSYRDVKPVTDLVTDDECFAAMQYLDETAHDLAKAQSDADYLEYMISAAEAVAALYSDERSVDKRKWDARASPSYLQRLEEWRDAKRTFLALRAKHEAAKLKVEVWRTIHADKRARDVPEPGQRASRADPPHRPPARGEYDDAAHSWSPT